MQYINPFDLLNIQSENLNDIESSVIRRAKNNLIADIELSDHKHIVYKGIQLTKPDCIRVIDELDNNDKKEFHFFIFKNSGLNLFLTKGDLQFFSTYKVESIYKLPEFLDFISPYFADQYDKLLSNNYKKGNEKKITEILSVKPITNEIYLEKCYKSTHAYLRKMNNEIKDITKEIDNGSAINTREYFENIHLKVKKIVAPELLNLLPSYFLNIRDSLGDSVRYLAVIIHNIQWDKSDSDLSKDLLVPFYIIEIAKEINCTGLPAKKIRDNYFVLKKHFDIQFANETISNNDNLGQQFEVKFEAKVNKKSIALDEKFKIEFSMNFDGDNFTQPSFNGFYILSGPSQEVSQSWVEGKSIFNKTYSYFLMPKQKGPLTIEEASIEFNSQIYKTNIIRINEPVISSQNHQSIDNNKEQSNNLLYLLFLCLTLAIGFIYNPVQKIILGISLLIWLITYFSVIKDDLFLRNTFIKKNILEISCLVLGFFYPIIAQLFISYTFLIYLEILIKEFRYKKKDEKSKLGFYYYLIGSILITFLYNNYDGSATNLFASESILSQKELTDKQYFENGQSLFNESKFKDAIIQFNKAISLNPNYAEAYGDRGTSKQFLNQYEEAIKDYLLAHKLGLNTTYLYSNLGFSYYKINDSNKALSYFEKALELDAFNADALRYRGEIKYDSDDYNGAIEDYTKAIKINPDASYYFSRGLAFYYLKDYKNALKDMDVAIKLDPAKGQYYYDRGDTKELMNDIYAASIDWKTAKSKGYDVPDYKINKYIPQVINVFDGELIGCNIIPKYNKKLNNKLVINVGSNANVAVKLINFKTEKCIRYVFINKNSEYSIRNIPEGTYYLKIAYGNDWSKIQDQPECSGRFTKNTIFEKGEEILDFNLVHSGNGYQVPSFSLKLDVIISEDKMSTFNTDKINENDFYNE
ncbi:tetratricopeptide repeat protein [Flavobacterium sp. WC2429]|uniref:Tetratricopeptide repeat protein n=1 Tax=Flavobacterium sp. WC2429 TaxID=3234140 RepID=A0AB39WM70_9FLAO